MKEIKNGMYCNLLPVVLSIDEVKGKLAPNGNDKLSYSICEAGYVSEDGAVILIENRSPYYGMLMKNRECTAEEKIKWVKYICELFGIDINDYVDETQSNAWDEYFEKCANPKSDFDNLIIPNEPELEEEIPSPPDVSAPVANTPVSSANNTSTSTTPVTASTQPIIDTNYKPNILGDTKGLPNDVWLEWRAHGPQGDIPFTLGGSDIAAVFGVSPWKTPLELWKEKRGELERKEPDNPDQLEMGHLLEPIAAHWFGKKTGLTYYEDTTFYQHPRYEWALANVDRRYTTEDGEPAVLECKCTSFHKRDDWAEDKYPYYYELQVRFYMAVLNVNHGAFACLWGNNPANDFKYPFVERDLEIEKMIFDVCQEFIDSLYAGVPPTMEGVKTETALKALKRIYEKGNALLPPIEFGDKNGKVLKRISEIDADIKRKKDELKALEDQRDEYTVKIIEALKENESGVYTDKDGTVYTAKYPTKTTNRIDTKRLKEEDPETYNKWLKPSVSRTFSVKVKAPN